ncbi:MAG: DUF6527 family protein [Anaerotignum sp.]|nr:DUF6527 family protein [Anaerotignum sp.]
MNFKTRSCCFFSGFQKNYKIKLVDDIPVKCLEKTIYIVGNPATPQYAIFKCPCGCGKNVELNLNVSTSPCWKLNWNWFGTISFSPSIWRKDGCHSHFFLKNSEIKWCK